MTNLHKMALVRRFLRSRKGNIAIISALMMPAIVGFCGLAGETAYWYYRHRDIQGAADLAAFGGAAVLRSGSNSLTAITAASKADAVTNGWRQANGTIAVNWPPTSGSWQNQQSVQVILTENQTRIFSRLFNGSAAVPISVRSTATVLVAGPACILGLNNSAANTVWFQGNSTTTLTNCNVATNSSNALGFVQSGSSTAWMPCAYSSGGETHTAGLHLTSCGNVVQHHPRTVDPYANVPAPSFNPASCSASNTQNNAVVLQKGCFNSMQFNSQNPTILTGGNYIVNGGDFQINAGADVRCQPVPPENGCMFYFANNSNIDVMAGNAHVEMTAQTSGPWAGLAFFGARTNNWAENQFNGTNDSLINGAVYFPSQKVTFNGNFTGTNGCTQVIADTIYYSGNGTFSSNCTGYGMKTAMVYGAVSLVE